MKRAGLRGAPLRLRAYVGLLGLAATTAAILGPAPILDIDAPRTLVGVALVLVAGFHVEAGRHLALRYGYPLHPHRGLSSWALAAALLLPTWWLLLVVPISTTHVCRRDPSTRRGPRWFPAGSEIVLCAVGASALAQVVAEVIGDAVGVGLRTALVATVAALAFLAGEVALGLVARSLRITGVRWWSRGRRLTRSGLPTELVALTGGAALAAVWTLDLWLALFITTTTLVVQQARLNLPLRARLAAESRLIAENEKLATLVDTLSTRNSDLDDLIEFKTDLMSMLGHEISNPLTSVLGFSQIGIAAAADDDADSAGAALRTVERNARKVADVLSDIRQLLASERGGITAAPETVALGPRLRAAIDDRSRTRRPDLRCPDDLRVRVQPGHLDQIMANLLSNAAKYAGGATDVSVVTAEGQPWVTVTVSDSGPGVSDQGRNHLFERYWRDSEASRNVPGTGIGLFISRELARANGGDLVHEPAAPTGSRFILTLARAV